MGGGGFGANNVIEITRVQCRSWAVRVRQSSGMEQAGVRVSLWSWASKSETGDEVEADGGSDADRMETDWGGNLEDRDELV